jgi:SNF2 family DNA or RNA helicase
MSDTVAVISTKLGLFDHFIKNTTLDQKPHQRDGVKWMIEREISLNPLQGVRGGLVADEMGLGKTIQVIGVIIANFKPRTLIVLPLALLNQWQEQLIKFTGHNALVYHGLAKNNISIQELIAAPIVLTTYGNCQCSKGSMKNILHRIPWDRVVFDEAHHLRNETTRSHMGAIQIQAPIRWLVTGTPIQNRKADFFALCRVLGYQKDYCVDSDNLLKIAKWSLLKRTKEQVGIKLPQVNKKNIQVEWKNKDESMLAEDIHGLLSFAEVRTDRQTNTAVAAMGSSVLPALVRCRQSCVYPKLMGNAIKKLDDSGFLDSSEYDLTKAVNSSSKLDSVCDKIIERKDNGRGKLVFCHFRGEIDAIYERLSAVNMKVAIFDGRTHYSQRQEILSDITLDVLILQIMTGSEGLNLQHFKEIYFVSPHWNPAVEDQAIARCHRIGQEDEVDIFRFTMTGFDENSRTLDTYASEVQDSKRKMYNIIDDEDVVSPYK